MEKTHSIGLNNIGATCYMNATLQCLANIKHLTTTLLKESQNFKNPYKYKLTSAFIEVLKNLWESNKRSYSPDNFKKIISEMNPLFNGIQANDSKDLIIFLLEKLHKELNNVEKPKTVIQNRINQYDYESCFKAFSNYYTNNYKTVISDIFYGMFNSMMTCFNCNVTVNNIQIFNILIFPLNEVRLFKKRSQNFVNIYECFEYYQKTELMSGNNQIYCNNCHSMSNSLNMSKLIISPHVLVINLNRGKGLQFDIKFSFEENLDITNYVYYSSQCPTKYQLVGIVVHFGPSSIDGHFIAFCKSYKDNKWYKYNDATVTQSDFNEVQITGVPYILFYSSEKYN
jgi:ubiquitin C-terminal hydrolase